MDRPFSLAPDSISHDTIEALRALLKDAEKGEVIGLAFAVMYKGRDYIVNTAGEAHRSPTFARGMVQALDDHLMHMVHE
ncbi:hypothetical protein SAMN05216404_106187 [Nitrosospira multiformis]|uniref:Uncharacterized protein n=1 Tax=Nitrosospira multiformis TaxID=1231 RepID=A0A1H8IW17_9PROT|nr:hypothetical protein [Nitrosospira multiformis]SEN72147.1 hypothetical protein SAMN05216404_106187 [Nitrosospira multiformis]